MKTLETLLKGIIIGMLFCMVVYTLTSCSRKYVIEGPKGSCGVWYPKKFGGGRNW